VIGGWWLLLAAWCRRHASLTVLVRDHARERLALKRQVVVARADLAIAQQQIAGQHIEAARMSNELGRVQSELDAHRVLLGRMSNRNQIRKTTP
jgi:hypothetical protein